MNRLMLAMCLYGVLFASCVPGNVVAPDAREGDSEDETVDVDADGDGSTSSVDCNDTNASIHPGATELDNGIDDDCDGTIDEGTTTTTDTDADDDGYTTDPQDCNDADPAIHPGATEDCDDGKDNDCDGYIDGADNGCQISTPTPAPSYDGSEVSITVAYASTTPAVDFSFGYCSNLTDPADCSAWNQSVVTRTNTSSVTYTIQNVTGGVIRANSSRFLQESDYNSSNQTWQNADAWLCENGTSSSEMTGTVSVAIDGVSAGNGGAYCFYYGNGSGLGIRLDSLM